MKYKRLFGIIVLAILTFAVSGCESKYQKIESKQRAGMYKETVSDLEEMIEKSPDDAKAHSLLGNAYLNIGLIVTSEERFNSALLTSSEKNKAFMKRSICEKYKNALLKFLEAGKSGDQYLFDKMVKLDDKATLNFAEDHLKDFCDNYMNRVGYKQVLKGYKYLVKLNPSLKNEIAQKHLKLFDEVSDQKFKIRIINDAIKFSQEVFISKVYADYYYKLSKQAKTTEERVAKLKNANRFGHYKAELQAGQGQLKLEVFQKNIGKFIIDRGKLDFDKVLTKKGKKHYIFKDPKVNDEFHYLSSGGFTGGDDGGEIKCVTALNSCEILGYFSHASIKGDFYITKRNSNVRVVGWIKK